MQNTYLMAQNLEISEKLKNLTLKADNDSYETEVLYSYSQAVSSGMSQNEFTKNLAKHLEVVYINPNTLQNWQLPVLSGAEVEAILDLKLIHFDTLEDGIRILVASDIANLPVLKSLVAQDVTMKTRIFLCTPQNFVTFIYKNFGSNLLEHTTKTLEIKTPQFSAKLSMPLAIQFGIGVTILCAIYCLSIFASPVILHGAMVVLSLCFAGGAILRLVAFVAALYFKQQAPLQNYTLPTYSVLVPLYKEVEIIPQLIHALKSLEYPPELLDIKLILESHDIETNSAINNLDLPAYFEVIVVPDSEPRTKPKALMSALPRVKGDLVCIYDAEDVPDPLQLDKIVQKFRCLSSEYGCIQAALTIDQRQKGILQQLFALEYETWFTLFLRGFAALKLPLPLGGTSNHFKTNILKEIGGWDPYNVTEDADLGLRLARFGYKTSVISSSTLEEAPATLKDWMNQRTRWMKGWFQTLAVHYQNPRAVVHEMGVWHGIAVLLVFGGSLLGAMLFPISIVLVGILYYYPEYFLPTTPLGLVSFSIMNFIFIFGISVPIFANLYRAILSRNIVWICLIPILPLYWMLISFAGWRACLELNSRPFYWHKTPHKGIQRH